MPDSRHFNPQFSAEELEFDAVHLFDIMFHDPDFEGLMQSLTHCDAADAVYEAIELLQTAPEPETKGELFDLSLRVWTGFVNLHMYLHMYGFCRL